jgi:hypothetical protein
MAVSTERRTVGIGLLSLSVVALAIEAFLATTSSVTVWNMLVGIPFWATLSFSVSYISLGRGRGNGFELALVWLGVPVALFQLVQLLQVYVAFPFMSVASPFRLLSAITGISQVTAALYLIPFLNLPLFMLSWYLGRVMRLKSAPTFALVGGALILLSELIFASLFELTGSSFVVILTAPLALSTFPLVIRLASRRGDVKPSNIENQVLRYLEEHHYQVSLSVMAHELSITQDELNGILEALQKKGHVQ